jgi:hypothetical protein
MEYHSLRTAIADLLAYTNIDVQGACETARSGEPHILRPMKKGPSYPCWSGGVRVSRQRPAMFPCLDPIR